MSIEHTARHGADAGYEVVVASDGTSTTGEEWQNAALNYAMTNVAKVATCAEIKTRSRLVTALQSDLVLRQGYIDGAWVDADSGATFAVTNPASGEVVAEVPRMGAAETRRAIEAAQRALPGWRGMLAKERAAHHAPLGRPDDRPPGGPRGAADHRAGQAAGRVARRGRLRGELPGVVRRGGQARLRRHHPDLHARPAHRGGQGARRRDRRASRRGTSRPRCPRARRRRRWAPAARWCSSPPSRRR